MWRSAVLSDHPLGFFLLLLVPGPLGYSIIEKCSIRYYTFHNTEGANAALFFALKSDIIGSDDDG